MRRFLCLLVSLFLLWPLAAQDEEILRAARYLSGASSEEEIDAYWITRLEGRQGRRIRINDPHPRADGLLSEYQLATLADYRARQGDILSWEELALVDGFSREWVALMRPFLSLASSRLPGAADTLRLQAAALARVSLSGVGAKAKAQGSFWRAGAAWRGKEGSFYAEAAYREHRLLLGYYNLRLGQGLAFWSGFSMSSLSTVDAFIKRTPGLSPVWSYAPEAVHRGAAYSYSGVHWRAQAFGSLAGNAGGHLDYLLPNGQLGMTLGWDWQQHSLTAALDTRWNWRGADLVAEAAWRNRSLAALAACRRAWGPVKAAGQLRIIPSRFSGGKQGEYGLALGTSYQSERWTTLRGRSGFGSSVPAHRTSLTVDAALLPLPASGESRRLQLRIYGGWQWQLTGLCSLDTRFTERYRNYEPPRSDLRSDLHLDGGPWNATFRLETDYCDGWGFLGYLEGGLKGTALTGYLRLTAFHIDAWSARIYCYERDAPGTFSVPAYHGRGLALSALLAWKRRFRHFRVKAYLRGGWKLRVQEKPSPTLNLQLHCEL